MTIFIGVVALIFSGLVALFTGLYWGDTRRAYLLELDRVALWYRLQTGREQLKEGEIDQIVERFSKQSSLPTQKKEEVVAWLREDLEISPIVDRVAGDQAFLETLRSKKLRYRLIEYRNKETEIASKLDEILREGWKGTFRRKQEPPS